ncbi:MAG: hypothetical protein D6710_09595 [Nitrospirae bacterium]|nr:MAG: hypothetical protein D6710_09595 [Nitrospirota bacterium]
MLLLQANQQIHRKGKGFYEIGKRVVVLGFQRGEAPLRGSAPQTPRIKYFFPIWGFKGAKPLCVLY